MNVATPPSLSLERTATALSGTFTKLTVDSAHGARSRTPEYGVRVWTWWVAWENETGSPTEVAVYFTKDSAGDIPLTPIGYYDIVDGQTSGAAGAADTFNGAAWPTDGAAYYMWFKFNDGTAPTADLVEAGVTWSE